jgi:putative ABC transport system permease protein
MTLSRSITLTVDNELGRRDYQGLLTFEEAQRIDRVTQMAESLEGVEAAEVRFSRSVSLLKIGQRTKEAGVGARLVGVPAGSQMYQPLVVAGRWLQPEDGQAIVMSEETAEENGITLGEWVTLDLGDLGDQEWQVVGFYRTIAVVPVPDNIYAPQEVIFRVTPKHNIGHDLLVRFQVEDADLAGSATVRLKEMFEKRNWEVADTQTLYEEQAFFDNFFAQYIPMHLALAIIMAIVGGIGLMGALSISVTERTKEIGVMRAIGAKTPVIMGMLVLEGILQGLFSWAIALPLSFLLGQPLAALMGEAMFNIALDYQYDLQAVLIWLAMVVVISILASVMPARNATRISVRESLAYA